MRRSPLPLSFALTLVSSTFAGNVHVIDVQNGPGTHFTSVEAGLAAAQDGDLLLVRSGVYDGDHLFGAKAVSIVADDGAAVTLTDSTPLFFGDPGLGVIGPLAKPLVLRGLSIASGPSPGISGSIYGLRVNVDATAPGAHVFVEDCHVTFAVDAGMFLGGTAPLTVTRCSSLGGDGRAVGTSLFAAKPGAWILSRRVSMFSSTMVGGTGYAAGIVPSAPGAGGTGGSGIEVQLSSAGPLETVVSGTTAFGGFGGDATLFPGCHVPGDGGAGLMTIISTTHVVAPSFTGGQPGNFGAPCTQPGASGAAESVVFFGLPAIHLPGTPGRVTSLGPRREGQPLAVLVEGQAGHDTYLVAGDAPTHLFVPSAGGSLVADPDLVLSLGTMPVTTQIVLTATTPQLPAGVSHGLVYLQVITRDPVTHDLTIGAPSVLVVLDAAL